MVFDREHWGNTGNSELQSKNIYEFQVICMYFVSFLLVVLWSFGVLPIFFFFLSYHITEKAITLYNEH